MYLSYFEQLLSRAAKLITPTTKRMPTDIHVHVPRCELPLLYHDCKLRIGEI